MDLPDLPPEISFELLPQTADAVAFAFEVKRAAIGPHITARWGWDEDLQKHIHQQQFRERRVLRIVFHGQAIGTVALTQQPDYIRFDDFYLLPAYQGEGLGSRILEHCLAVADGYRIPIRLQHLKWNPVGSLYRRHGFRVIGETESQFVMERQPNETSPFRRG